jgi:hypothetical protein
MSIENPDISTGIADSGSPRQPYTGPTQQDTSAPTPPNIQPDQQAQMVSPVAPAAQQQPSVTTPPVAPSPNQRLHSFVSSVLSGITTSLAGKAPVRYSVDPATGKMGPDPNQPEDTRGAQGRRILGNALTGLGAGAQAGGQKSGLANALAGLGAGASAQTASSQAADKQARQQANEDFEKQQQLLLRKKSIAEANAHLWTMTQEQRRIEEDRDPHRQQALSQAKNAEEAGVPVEYTTESDLKQRDPSFFTTHQVLPIGMKRVTDAQGQPVLDEDGMPKMEAQFALIDGLHDGKLPVPADFVSDLQKYGKYVGVTGMDSLKPGDEVSMQHFIEMYGKITEGKKTELAGWAKATLSWTGPNQDKPVLVNSNTGEVKAFSNDPNAVPNAANKPESAGAKNALTEAQTAEAKAKTKEALGNAALIAQQVSGSGGGSLNKDAIPAYVDAISQLPPTSKAILQAVRPDDQLALLAVAGGDADISKTFPTRTTAKSGQMDAAKATGLVKLLNPDWNTQYYKAVQEATDNMVKGPDHKGVLSFGQFLVHADDVRQGSLKLARSNSPWFNKPFNEIRSKGLGDPNVGNLIIDIMAARNEWETFINSNHVPSSDEKKAAAIVMDDSSTPAMMMGGLGEMGKQAVGRLDQINEGYKTVTHRDWPNLIPPMSRQAAINLGLGDQIAKYKTAGTLRGAMNAGSSVTGQAQPSAQTPHEVIAGGKVVGYTIDGKTMTTNPPAGARPVGTVAQ